MRPRIGATDVTRPLLRSASAGRGSALRPALPGNAVLERFRGSSLGAFRFRGSSHDGRSLVDGRPLSRRTCPRRSRIREAHIPAQHPPSSPQARLSRPHAHPCRPRDHQGQAAQGSHAAVGLIWRIRARRAFQTSGTLPVARPDPRPCGAPFSTIPRRYRCASPSRSAARSVRPRDAIGCVVSSVRSSPRPAPELGLASGWLLIGANPPQANIRSPRCAARSTALLTRAPAARRPSTRCPSARWAVRLIDWYQRARRGPPLTVPLHALLLDVRPRGLELHGAGAGCG